MVRSSASTDERRPYHHGNLRETLLAVAADVVATDGPAALGLRDVARRAGVSHAAVTYHFGDKTGLLTALAVEAAEELAATLTEAAPAGFLEVGVAYVAFAARRPGHFAVLFRNDLIDGTDPRLMAAREAGARVLYGEVPSILAGEADALTGGVAAWALVHGLAELRAAGALPPGMPSEPEELTRAVAAHLVARGRPDVPGD